MKQLNNLCSAFTITLHCNIAQAKLVTLLYSINRPTRFLLVSVTVESITVCCFFAVLAFARVSHQFVAILLTLSSTLVIILLLLLLFFCVFTFVAVE